MLKNWDDLCVEIEKNCSFTRFPKDRFREGYNISEGNTHMNVLSHKQGQKLTTLVIYVTTGLIFK